MISDIAMLSHLNQTSPVKALEKACKEFETLFAHQILKTMGESLPDDGIVEKTFAEEMFKDMLYLEVARCVGDSGGLGIGDILKRHIQERFGEDGKSGPNREKTDKEVKAENAPEKIR